MGQAVPPTSFDAFPDLGTSITELEAGDVPKAALERAGATAEQAASSAENVRPLLEAIAPADIAGGKGLSRLFVSYFLDSHNLFVQAVASYDQAARLTTMAVEADDEATREGLVARARGVFDVAEELFARAYADYLEAQVAGGIFQPSALPAPTGPAG
jgi:hypothetical protein